VAGFTIGAVAVVIVAVNMKLSKPYDFLELDFLELAQHLAE
jgi:hypothetical protein